MMPLLMNVKVDPIMKTVGNFGKHEVEHAAGMLVLFLKYKCAGWWLEFSLADLHKFYESEKEDPTMMLYGILGSWFDDGSMDVHKDGDYLCHTRNGYMVTEKFVKKVSNEGRTRRR